MLFLTKMHLLPRVESNALPQFKGAHPQIYYIETDKFVLFTKSTESERINIA